MLTFELRPQDVSSAVAKLDAVLLSVALIILIFVFLLIFNKSDTLSSLVPLATIILGFSFVFGNSAKTLFESVRPPCFSLKFSSVVSDWELSQLTRFHS